VECDPDDGVTIYAAIADPGEGNDSMVTQIAAHLLALPMEKVRLVTRTTELTTAMGPAAASRMTYMGGGAMVHAIEEMKKAMAEAGARSHEALKKAGKPTRYMGTKKKRMKDLLTLKPARVLPLRPRSTPSKWRKRK
jgi:aldehyde oxidoreductase